MNTRCSNKLKSKPVRVSLKTSVIIMLLTSLFYSCNNIRNELGDCIIYCNPAECLVLDEEKCECITDLECLQEMYYSGIKPEDCICQEADGGKWCSALTGDSIKSWKVIYAYDTIQNDTLTGLIIPYVDDFAFGQYQYRVDHLYKHCWDDSCYTFENDLFYWEFNDMMQPSKIMYSRIVSRSGYDNPKEFVRTIIKLNPDTLITTWHEGEFPGWILLVPAEG